MDFYYDTKQHGVGSYSGGQSITVSISGDNSLIMTAEAARGLASMLTYHADLLEGLPTGTTSTPLPTLAAAGIEPADMADAQNAVAAFTEGATK